MKKSYIYVFLLFLLIHPTFPVTIGKERPDKCPEKCSSDDICCEGEFCAGIELATEGNCQMIPKRPESKIIFTAITADSCQAGVVGSCNGDSPFCGRCRFTNKFHKCQKCAEANEVCTEDPWERPERPNKCCSGLCRRGRCLSKAAECLTCEYLSNDPTKNCCPSGEICNKIGKCQNSCSIIGQYCDGIKGPFCCDKFAVCEGIFDSLNDKNTQVCKLKSDKIEPSNKETVIKNPTTYHEEFTSPIHDPNTCIELYNSCSDSSKCCNDALCKEVNGIKQCLDKLHCYSVDEEGCCNDEDCCDHKNDKNVKCDNKICIVHHFEKKMPPEVKSGPNCIPENDPQDCFQSGLNCCNGFCFQIDLTNKQGVCKNCGAINDFCLNHFECCNGTKCYYGHKGAPVKGDISCQAQPKCVAIGYTCDPEGTQENPEMQHGNVRVCCGKEKALELCKNPEYSKHKDCEKLLKDENLKNQGIFCSKEASINTDVYTCLIDRICSEVGETCGRGGCCDSVKNSCQKEFDKNNRENNLLVCKPKITHFNDPCDPVNPNCPAHSICIDETCKECHESGKECSTGPITRCCDKEEHCLPDSTAGQSTFKCRRPVCINAGQSFILRNNVDIVLDCCPSGNDSTQVEKLENKCTECIKEKYACGKGSTLNCCSGHFCVIKIDGSGYECGKDKEQCIHKGKSCTNHPDKCCVGFQCIYSPYNKEGIKEKICQDLQPPCVKTLRASCDNKIDCCIGMFCDNEICNSCIEMNKGKCVDSSQCCGSKDKSTITIVCYKGNCVPESHCLIDGDDCNPIGGKSCCNKCDADTNKCSNCILLGDVCKKDQICCQSGQCRYTEGGETQICTKSDKIACIKEDSPCDEAVSLGQKCCKGKCHKNQCKSCPVEGDVCKGIDDCCNGLICAFHHEDKVNKCIMKPICLEPIFGCDALVKMQIPCCKSQECIENKCKDCIRDPKQQCETHEDCCVGLQCHFNGDSTSSKSCSSERICSKTNCEFTPEQTPKCCDFHKCVTNMCQKCEGLNKECKKNEDCCDSSHICTWDEDGIKLVCKSKESDCVKINCDVITSDFLKTQLILKIPVRKCCGELVCDNGKCSDCIKYTSDVPCGLKPTDRKCCAGGSCYDVSAGTEPILRCKRTASCIEPNDNVKCGKKSQPPCCENYKCNNGRCTNCIAKGNDCTEASICCGELECNNHPMENRKICIEKGLGCISNGGICNDKDRKCCHAVCHMEENASIGICMPLCNVNGQKCSKNQPCCSGKCVFNENGVKICGFRNECQIKKNAMCGKWHYKDSIFEIPEPNADIETLSPTCCPPMLCYNNNCKICILENQECGRGDKKCCDGDNNCNWNNEGTFMVCHKQHNTCIGEGKMCFTTDDDKLKYGSQIKSKACCDNLNCNSNGICALCIKEELECIPGSTKCCHGSCLPNSFGKFQCLTKGAECIEIEGDCVETGDGIVPCCPNKEGLTPVCFKGKCSNCIPPANSPTPRPCRSSTECCTGKCYPDSKSDLKFCFDVVQCREEKMPCDELQEEDGVFTMKCCGGKTCYKRKGADVSTCHKEICKVDDTPCKDSIECCTGKCVQSANGNMVCGYSDVCIDLGNSCKQLLIIDGNGSILPGCCPSLNNENIECNFENKCAKCQVNHSPCIHPNLCCSGKCGWNEGGTSLICEPATEKFCVMKKGKCGSMNIELPSGNGLIPKDFPPFRPTAQTCCTDLKCYGNRCVNTLCLDDKAHCKSDGDCCSKICWYEGDGGKMICQPKPKDKCMDLDHACGFPVEGSTPPTTAPCCNSLTCTNIDGLQKCKDCTPPQISCNPKKHNCCSGICSWKSDGSDITCIAKGHSPCISNQGLCDNDDEELKDKIYLLKRKCCDGHSCYKKKCKLCEKQDDEICTVHSQCCSGTCKWTKDGTKKCVQPGIIDDCVDKLLDGCIDKSELESQDSKFLCCNDQSYYCINGQCKYCYPITTPCESDANCCSGVCGWDSRGKSKICTTSNYCIEVNAPCSSDYRTIPVPNAIMHPKKCCGKSICYESRCQICKDDKDFCDGDEDCCSKICAFNSSGNKVCSNIPTNCQQAEHYCGQALAPSFGTAECCEGFDCLENKCVPSKVAIPCKESGEICEIGQCCGFLGCYYDESGINKKCSNSQTGTCSKFKCFPGILDCCDDKLCFKNTCHDCIPEGSDKVCCMDKQCCGELVCRNEHCVDKCLKIGHDCAENTDCCGETICDRKYKVCIKKDCEELDKHLLEKLWSIASNEGNDKFKRGNNNIEDDQKDLEDFKNAKFKKKSSILNKATTQRFKKLRIYDSTPQTPLNITSFTSSPTNCQSSADCNANSTCVRMRERQVCMDDHTLSYLKGLERRMALKRLYKTSN